LILNNVLYVRAEVLLLPGDPSSADRTQYGGNMMGLHRAERRREKLKRWKRESTERSYQILSFSKSN
jgi:hypothetical protein